MRTPRGKGRRGWGPGPRRRKGKKQEAMLLGVRERRGERAGTQDGRLEEGILTKKGQGPVTLTKGSGEGCREEQSKGDNRTARHQKKRWRRQAPAESSGGKKASLRKAFGEKYKKRDEAVRDMGMHLQPKWLLGGKVTGHSVTNRTVQGKGAEEEVFKMARIRREGLSNGASETSRKVPATRRFSVRETNRYKDSFGGRETTGRGKKNNPLRFRMI